MISVTWSLMSVLLIASETARPVFRPRCPLTFFCRPPCSYPTWPLSPAVPRAVATQSTKENPSEMTHKVQGPNSQRFLDFAALPLPILFLFPGTTSDCMLIQGSLSNALLSRGNERSRRKRSSRKWELWQSTISWYLHPRHLLGNLWAKPQFNDAITVWNMHWP